MGKIRQFKTGATRDTAEGKLDFEGFMSPIVLLRYAEYLDKHRQQSDGTFRGSDNWQGLFGNEHESVCMKSLSRHYMDVWLIHRGFIKRARESLQDALCAIIFNASAYPWR